jgi:putative membrane protein
VADAVALLVLAAAAATYAMGVTRCWTVAGPGRLVRRPQVLAATSAFAALLVALGPPLADAAHRDLAWHMTQHVLLLGAAAPLLAFGAPLTAWLYALPARARRRAQPAWRGVLRTQTGRSWLPWLAASFVLANLTVAVWHLPPLYDAALRHEAIHWFEHLSFVTTAALFWWMVLGAGRASRRGPGVLALFASTMPAAALGVLMTMATTCWYAPYGNSAAALRAQQVAGAVMWGFGGAVAVIGGAAVFASWLHAMDRVDAP